MADWSYFARNAPLGVVSDLLQPNPALSDTGTISQFMPSSPLILRDSHLQKLFIISGSNNKKVIVFCVKIIWDGVAGKIQSMQSR
jgi:hypothetical protein